MFDDLTQLAKIMSQRNELDRQIAAIISRPAEKGHIGEYIASRILNIALNPSATHKGIDGHFTDGALKGRTVNIKLYGKHEGILDMPKDAADKPSHLPDYYLILTGPNGVAMSSRNTHRPSVIHSVFLFETYSLIDGLMQRAKTRGKDMKFGVAASVPQEFWKTAEIYPTQQNTALLLTEEQRKLLALFQ
jgi:hypothetical protein